MTRVQKLESVTSLSALKDTIPTTADLWLLAEWMFNLKKVFHQYLPTNDLPEEIAGLLYVVDGSVLKIVPHADYAQRIKLAKMMLGIAISNLKATLDIGGIK